MPPLKPVSIIHTVDGLMQVGWLEDIMPVCYFTQAEQKAVKKAEPFCFHLLVLVHNSQTRERDTFLLFYTEA